MKGCDFMGKAGYIIFNAEGKKPQMTVGAIRDDKDIQVIFNGVDPLDTMMLIGIICNSMLKKTDVSKEKFFEALGVVMDEVSPITDEGELYELGKD
jgi:hypothetical protein